MGSLKHFDRPQNLIDWAEAAIDEFVAEWAAYGEAGIFKVVVEEDAEAGVTTHKLVLAKPLPINLERKGSEALINLKHSFDQSLFAACMAIGQPIRKGNYKWTDTEKTWKGLRTSNSDATPGNRIAPEVWDEMERQAPYRRGDNDTFARNVTRDLASFANDKHTVGFVVDCKIGPSSNRVVIKHMSGYGRLSTFVPTWDTVKQEAVLQETSGTATIDGSIEYRFAPYVVFDADPPLREVEALAALRMFVKRAKETLEGFKNVAIKMGAA